MLKTGEMFKNVKMLNCLGEIAPPKMGGQFPQAI